MATYAITAVYPNLSLNCFLMGALLKLIADPLNTLLHMISVLFTLYNKRLSFCVYKDGSYHTYLYANVQSI